jgi:hypothetical protein
MTPKTTTAKKTKRAPGRNARRATPADGFPPSLPVTGLEIRIGPNSAAICCNGFVLAGLMNSGPANLAPEIALAIGRAAKMPLARL